MGMRILIVSFYYLPELGAAPSRITNLAEGLRDRDQEVEVLTCMPNYPKGRIFENYRKKFSMCEKLNGIKVHRYWTYATTSRNVFLRLFSMFSFAVAVWFFALKVRMIKKYDRIIIQSPPILVAYSAMILFKCLYRRTTILNVSDLWPASAVELGAVKEGSIFYKVLLYIEKFLYRKANAVMGQSSVILQHVLSLEASKTTFLYRNLQHGVEVPAKVISKCRKFRIFYAGLMGVSQDILGLIKTVDFNGLNAELHLYGGGNQLEDIRAYISNHERHVFYHGFLDKKSMVQELMKYDASIVPLVVSITGAVPSKIFDLLPVGVPILFCGGGEGAEIVRNYKIGLVADSGDYVALMNNIKTFVGMKEEEYGKLVENCLNASRNDFCFEKQMEEFVNFIKNL